MKNSFKCKNIFLGHTFGLNIHSHVGFVQSLSQCEVAVPSLKSATMATVICTCKAADNRCIIIKMRMFSDATV